MNNKVAIKVNDLNKKFKSGYGIKDINFTVEYGKVFGYLGPNGAGKSTTLRILMGFMKSDKGNSTLSYNKKDNNGTTVSIGELISLDSWTDSSRIQRRLGYVPGEIAFPVHMTGTDLLKQVFKLRNMQDWNVVKKYIEYWEFNPNIKIKKMSKGMKQKVALIIAWMHNPDIIVLDEPTTGLDPLMQDKFIKLVKKSKEEGRAIILSSHIFSEIEKTCDYVSIIKRGKIISTINIKDIQYNEEKKYEVSFKKDISNYDIKSDYWAVTDKYKNNYFITVKNSNINDFLIFLSKHDINFVKEHPLDLEQYFMKYYQNEIEKDVISSENNYVPKRKSNKESKVSLELVKDTSRKSLFLWLFMTILPIVMILVAFVVVLNNPDIKEQIESGRATWGAVINRLVLNMIASSTGMVYLLMMIYILVTGNGLVASEVEKGTLVNLLTTNQSRSSVILCKMFTFIGYISLSNLLFYITTIIGILLTGHSDTTDFKLITMYFLGLFLLLFLVSSLSFLASCYFNKSAYSLSLAGGLTILFYVLYFISQIDTSVSFFKYLSINSLFSTNYTSLDQLKEYLAQDIVMFSLGVTFYYLGYYIFIKKDLPL